MNTAVRMDPQFAELLTAERERRHAAIVAACEDQALLLLAQGIGESAAYSTALQAARRELAELDGWFNRALVLAGVLER